MTPERRQQLTSVYDYAKVFPELTHNTICKTLGINTPSGSVGIFITGARKGISLNDCFQEYRKGKRHKRVSKIEKFTDIQLKDELIRRGWEVTCKRTTIVEL